MAEDLNSFILEERDNLRRYRSNIEAIIKKYDKHFPDDVEIDLETMSSYTKKDEIILRRMKPKPIGHTKLFTTRRKELSETNRNWTAKDESVFSLRTDCDEESLIDLTLKASPSDQMLPDRTANKDVSLCTDSSLEENQSELLCLKTSYYEIISDKHDEPSDAETLSSYSSETFDEEIDSEEADDEDSQADDKIPYVNDIKHIDDSSSLSSTDDKETVTRKTIHQRQNFEVNWPSGIDEVDGGIICKHLTLPGRSTTESKVPQSDNRLYDKGEIMLNYKGQAKPNRLPGIGYEKKANIEKWVKDTNLKTGISPSRKPRPSSDKGDDSTDLDFVEIYGVKSERRLQENKDVKISTSNTSHDTCEGKVHMLPSKLIRRKGGNQLEPKANIHNRDFKDMNQTFTVTCLSNTHEFKRSLESRTYDTLEYTSGRSSEKTSCEDVEYHINVDDMNNNEMIISNEISSGSCSAISINLAEHEGNYRPNSWTRSLINDPSTSPLQFKKRIRRKFIPREDTSKLLNLIIQPQSDIVHTVSPSSFHKKYSKPRSDPQPFVETEQFLHRYRDQSSNSNKQYEGELSSQSNPGGIYTNWKMPQNTIVSKCQTESPKSSSLNAIMKVSNLQSAKQYDSTVRPAFKYANMDSQLSRPASSRFEINRTETIGNRHEHQPRRDNERNSSFDITYICNRDPQLSSPYKSAKDLTDIQVFANSSFHSPALPKKLSQYSYEDISKSVPAKLIHNNIELTSNRIRQSHDRSPMRFRRTKLRAKRSLPMDAGDTRHADNVSDRLSTQHTPSKGDMASPSACGLYDSPSSVLSRLQLNTPSPRSRDHFERFKARIPYLSRSTENSPRSQDLPSSESMQVEDRLQQGYIPYQQDVLRESRSSGTSLVSKCNSSRDTDRTLPVHTDQLTIPQWYVQKTTSEQFRKPSDIVRAQSSVPARRLLPCHDMLNVNGRRKALFQSTPMKRNDMCALDSTISTIHHSMSDDSDCEVATISNSP